MPRSKSTQNLSLEYIRIFRGRIREVIKKSGGCKIDEEGRECVTCRKYKDYTEYYRDPYKKSGYGSQCIECKKLIRKTYALDREKMARTFAIYYWNKGGKEKTHEYYLKNKDKYRLQGMKYRAQKRAKRAFKKSLLLALLFYYAYETKEKSIPES